MLHLAWFYGSYREAEIVRASWLFRRYPALAITFAFEQGQQTACEAPRGRLCR